MRNFVKPLLISAAAYLGYKFIAKAGAASSLNYSIAKVDITFSGLTPVLVITIAVQNPTNASFQFRSIVGDIYSNGNYLANLSSFTIVNIAPVAQTAIIANARLSLLGIATDVVDAIQGNGSYVQNIGFKGSVNVDGIVIPLTLGYKIG